MTTVLPPPLTHRCVSTRQHDQQSEVTRTRCLRGSSAAGRPMKAGQSACNVAVRLRPARRYAPASRQAWSAPVAAYEPLPGIRQGRSECLRIRPGTAVPLSPADLSASRQTMKLGKYAGTRARGPDPHSRRQRKSPAAGPPCRPPSSCDACSETQDRQLFDPARYARTGWCRWYTSSCSARSAARAGLLQADADRRGPTLFLAGDWVPRDVVAMPWYAGQQSLSLGRLRQLDDRRRRRRGASWLARSGRGRCGRPLPGVRPWPSGPGCGRGASGGARRGRAGASARCCSAGPGWRPWFGVASLLIRPSPPGR